MIECASSNQVAGDQLEGENRSLKFNREYVLERFIVIHAKRFSSQRAKIQSDYRSFKWLSYKVTPSMFV